MSSTRTRILDIARDITEEQGAAPTMSALARAVGISRQALYLHFADRTKLLLALVAHVSEQEQLQVGVDAITQAADGAAAIRTWAHLQAQRRPKLAAAGRALADTRHADPSASAAWADRADYRMQIATSITERLRKEGRLDPSWPTAEAAALLWELNSFHVWDDLVNDARIAPDRYVEIITAAALSALGASMRQPASSKKP
ncbi:MAG: TetR/AcrR family transcriptional regulator [Streptosporangiaceae bacterium]